MGAGQRVRERRAAEGELRLERPKNPGPGIFLWSRAVIALGFVLLATACGERAEPTGAEAPLYPVTVQGAGPRATVVREAPQQIVAFGAGMLDVLSVLGVGTRVVEGTREKARPEADLVVAWSSSDVAGVERAARGRPVYLGPDESVRKVERAIVELGLLVGEPLRARELVAAIERRRLEVTGRIAGRPAVTVFIDLGFFTTLSDRSLAGDLIRQAGGRSIAGPTPEPGPFNLKELARLDPDVYIATTDSGTTLADLRADPRTRGLTAVRKGRFGIIAPELLEPGPRLAESLEALAQLLHPDAFR